MSEKPRTRREVLATAALASGTFIAGCGSSDQEPTDSNETTGDSETNSTDNETADEMDDGMGEEGDDMAEEDDGMQEEDDEAEPPEEFPGEYTTETSSDGREYEQYIPASVSGDEDVPLFVGLHGCRQDGDRFATLTGFNELAEEEGFIAVYPIQPQSAQPLSCWLWWEDEHTKRGNDGEADEIVGVARETIENYAVDSSRVYTAGISAGASMVPNLLAEFPDVFAAGAIHSGTQYDAADGQSEGLSLGNDEGPDPDDQAEAAFEAMGDQASPLPTMVIHGTEDESFPFVHYEQNILQAVYTNNLVLDGDPIPEEPTTTEEGSTEEFDFRHEEYHAGEQGSIVEGLVVEGMGHAWAGGYPDTFHAPGAPEATQYIWDFFRGRTIDEPFQN